MKTKRLFTVQVTLNMYEKQMSISTCCWFVCWCHPRSFGMQLPWNEADRLPRRPFSQRFCFHRLRSTRRISWQSEKRERSWTRRRKSCRTSWIGPWWISIDSNRKPRHGKSRLCVFCFPKSRFNMSQNSQLQKLIVSYFGHISVNPNPFSCVSGDFYYLFLGVL